MNFEFAEEINPYLEQHDFKAAIGIGEAHLKSLPVSAFHAVIGRTFLHQVDGLVEWISQFYAEMAGKAEIRSLYFEMTEFDINTDEWTVTGFGLEVDDEEYDPYFTEWLCDVSPDLMTLEPFLLAGFEDLQAAFEEMEADSDALQDAKDWCEQMVIARFMELMVRAHGVAKERGLGWGRVPIYFTEHEYSFTLKSGRS